MIVGQRKFRPVAVARPPAAPTPRQRPGGDDAMHPALELSAEEGGVSNAVAVAYPTVTASGRTEKEALGLLMEAMEKYMRAQAKAAARA